MDDEVRLTALRLVERNLVWGLPTALPAVPLVAFLVVEGAPGRRELPWIVLTSLFLIIQNTSILVRRRVWGPSPRIGLIALCTASTGFAFGAAPTMARTPAEVTIALLCLSVVLFGNAVFTAPVPELAGCFALGATVAALPVLMTRGQSPPVLLGGLTIVLFVDGVNVLGLSRTITSNIAASRDNQALATEVQRANDELTAALATIEAIAAMDELTSLPNRRAFLASIDELLTCGGPCVVAMVDADHFKQVNDSYGHAAGDAALVAIARAVGRELRPTDLLGRLGGEEFAIALPGLGIDEGRQVLERVRQAVATDTAAGAAAVPLTVSIGAVAAWPRASVSEVLSAADEALYAAKRAGRNRTETGQRPRPASARFDATGTVAGTAAGTGTEPAVILDPG